MKRFSLQAHTLAIATVLGLSACSRSPSIEEVAAKVNASSAALALQQHPGQSLAYDHGVKSNLLRTEKFQHLVHGIPVIGSGISYHESQATQQISPHLAPLSSVDINTTPALSPDAIQARALALEPAATRIESLALKILPQQIAHTRPQPARLIYVVDLNNGKQLWLEANTGALIAMLSEHEDLVYSAANQGISANLRYGKKGLNGCDLATLDGRHAVSLHGLACQKKINASCQVLQDWTKDPIFHPEKCAAADDASAERAEENAQKFLEYFHSVHERDSYDGKGGAIVSMVHAGLGWAKARWYKKEKFLVYGDGNEEFRDFTYGQDIAAHELTHGLIQATAGLVGFGETGALNESIADFFGKMVEGKGSWNMGEGLARSAHAEDAFRDLSNPSRLEGYVFDSEAGMQKKPYPATRSEAAIVAEPCTSANDFCEIHFNSTIPGHTWYLLHQRLGQVKTEKLLFLALTQFYTELTDFNEAAKSTLAACSLFLSNADCGDVKRTFTETGMLLE